MNSLQDPSAIRGRPSDLPAAKSPTRRQILRLIAIAGVGAVGPTGCSRSITAAGWLGVHRHPASAAEIGRLWLRAQRRAPTTDDLLMTLAAPRDVASLNAAGIGIIRRHLLEKHHADFVAGRVVRVAGWLLSTTEATLYGLMARLAQDIE